MRKTIPFAAAILFFTSCNHTSQPKPDADRVIKDTLAQIILQPFNQSPQQQNIYVRVEPKNEKFFCPRDGSIKQMMEGLKTEPQKFVIDNTRPTKITGAQGTKLLFKPDCFINDAGQVSEPVTIVLKECYSLEDILHENLLTATGGGFSAGKGMVYVNAYSKGHMLQLKPGETINVQFPFALNGLNGYKIYHGDENADGLIAWNTVSGTKAISPKVSLSVDFVKPRFSYLGLGLKAYLLQTLNYPDEAKRNELSDKVDASFIVDADGRVKDITTAESFKIFRQAIEGALKNMPAWTPAAYNGKNIASSVHVGIDFNIRSADQVQIAFDENEASLISTGNAVYVLCGTNLQDETASDLSAQAFNQLGWFNCCKPLKAGKHGAEIIVCANEKSEVKLLMKNSAAIIGGENCVGYADFMNLPPGQQAYVIAVRCEGGDMYYAIQPLVLNKQTIISPKWKKGNSEDIAHAYKQLSKVVS